MTTIDDAHLCEMAFLDDCDRLCVIGVVTRFVVPSLPVEVTRLTIAAHLVNRRRSDPIDVGISIAAPNGLWVTPDSPERVDVQMAGEYVFITLRQLPLRYEGTYRFGVLVGIETAFTLEVPAFLRAEFALTS